MREKSDSVCCCFVFVFKSVSYTKSALVYIKNKIKKSSEVGLSRFCCQTFYPHLADDVCSLFDTQISRFRVQRFVKRQISAGSMADSLKRYPIN